MDKKDKSDCKCKEKEAKCECNKENERIEELTTDLKRVQAEFENYQKRTEKEFISRDARTRASILLQTLAVLDTINEAIKHETKNQALVKVKEVLVKFLHDNGVQKMTKKIGDQFDHEECKSNRAYLEHVLQRDIARYERRIMISRKRNTRDSQCKRKSEKGVVFKPANIHHEFGTKEPYKKVYTPSKQVQLAIVA